MDKLTMAHEWAMSVIHADVRAAIQGDLCELAWKYADAMQAEADKRKESGLPESLQPSVDWRIAPKSAYKWLKIGRNSMWVDQDGSMNMAPSFGFTGNHIVERP